MPRYQPESSNPFSFVIFGLLLKCPFGYSHTRCPISCLRSHDVSVEKKYRFAERLNSLQAYKILKKHNRCFQQRIEANINIQPASASQHTLTALEQLLNKSSTT